MQKTFSAAEITDVYMWQVPGEMPDFRVGNFLTTNHLQFTVEYEKELALQLQVVDSPDKVIFASEMEQMWAVARNSCPKEVRDQVPWDWHYVHWFLNCGEMMQLVPIEKLEEQMSRLSIAQGPDEVSLQ